MRLNPDVTSKPRLLQSLRNQALNDTSAPVVFYSATIASVATDVYYVSVILFCFVRL